MQPSKHIHFNPGDATVADRCSGRIPTVVACHLPIKVWHGAMQGPSSADAILNRLVHTACKVD